MALEDSTGRAGASRFVAGSMAFVGWPCRRAAARRCRGSGWCARRARSRARPTPSTSSPSTAGSTPRTATRSSCGATPTRDAPTTATSSSRARCSASTQGEAVIVNLTNTLPEPVSVVFPGQQAVTATGGSPGLLTTEAAATGGTVSYRFAAGRPGTYVYESGSDPAKQVEMGLYGALVVRPDATDCPAVAGTDCAYDARHAVQPGARVPAAARRDRPRPAPRGRNGRDVRHQRPTRPLLRHQRARVPRHGPGQRHRPVAQPAVRSPWSACNPTDRPTTGRR